MWNIKENSALFEEGDQQLKLLQYNYLWEDKTYSLCERSSSLYVLIFCIEIGIGFFKTETFTLFQTSGLVGS